MAAFDKSDLMLFGVLMLVLFVIAVITVLTYIGLDEMKSVACTQTDATYTWDGSTCDNTSGAAQTINTITKINIVEAAVDIALSLLGLVVLIAVFAVVIKIAIQFKDVF